MTLPIICPCHHSLHTHTRTLFTHIAKCYDHEYLKIYAGAWENVFEWRQFAYFMANFNWKCNKAKSQTQMKSVNNWNPQIMTASAAKSIENWESVETTTAAIKTQSNHNKLGSSLELTAVWDHALHLFILCISALLKYFH